MGRRRFLLYSTLGTVLWTGVLAATGYLLQGRYHQVAEWANPVSNAVIAILVLWYLYRVATFRRRRSEEHTSELQSLMRISYAVSCLKKKKNYMIKTNKTQTMTHPTNNITTT